MSKGSVKLLAIVAIIALFGCSWYSLINEATKQSSQYNTYLSTARERKERGFYDDAIDNYMSALNMSDTIKLREEIADYYLSSGHSDSYAGFLEEMISKYPHDASGYEKLSQYYSDSKNYSSCFSVMNKAKKRDVKSSMLDEIYASIKYVYEYINLGYEKVGLFSNGVSYAKKFDGKWGYLDTYGRNKLSFVYDDVSDYNGEFMTVKKTDGKYTIIDISGRSKSDDPESRDIEDCGYLSDNKMAVKYSGKYHYCNFDFKELFGAYDYAGTFSCGVAAVMNDGKWQIIDSEGKQVGNKTYSDIKVDEKGVAFRNNIGFVKDGDKYILVDTSGKRIGDDSWTDVDVFNGDQPAAVFNGSRWGFIDTNGKLVVDYTYGNAKSFSNGFAAVANQDKWGYISSEDYAIKIELTFTDANDFSKNGTSFVKKGNGWDMIKLYSYN